MGNLCSGPDASRGAPKGADYRHPSITKKIIDIKVNEDLKPKMAKTNIIPTP
jgi:hypothetical protein